MTHGKHFTYKTKFAFTMIELVMVIVVLGILASLAMPRLDRDLKQEAADAVLSNIRYTQHLALIDNKHSFSNPQWQRAFWKISFESCAGGGVFLSIGTDIDYQGDTDRNEAALDPINLKPMFWTNTEACTNGGDNTVSPDIFLTKKYGVTAVNGTQGCNGIQHIGFDHLGRPHVSFSASTTPNYSSYMNSVCRFTFTMSNSETFAIDIRPETGYANIVGQDGS